MQKVANVPAELVTVTAMPAVVHVAVAVVPAVAVKRYKSSREQRLTAPSHTTGHAGPHPAVQ